MLDKNIKYFRDNKKKFRELYPGKYLVIKNQKIIGIHDSHSVAYEESVKENEVGTFTIEHVKAEHS